LGGRCGLPLTRRADSRQPGANCSCRMLPRPAPASGSRSGVPCEQSDFRTGPVSDP